ncbi:MAG: hypothetical protein K0R38_7059, partial [Polyangiaceae bacterium]|nr:hypothetical protein [Polyangiaceae bacterium]
SAVASQTPSAAASAPARKPAARVRPLTSGKTPAAAKSPPSAKRALGSGDIVDPWAR